MKKKIFGISILIILWLAAVIACSLIFVELRQKSDGYTADNACTEFADHIYITDNAHGNGFLYMMNTTGEVEALFSVKDSLIEGFRVTDVDVFGEDLYIICERRHDDNGRVVNQYVTARLNESMQITGLTPVFRFPMELDLQGLDVAGDRIYVTALSENGQQAYVYTLGLSSLIGITGGSSTAADRTNWLNSVAEVKEYAMQESVRPRYMVQAIYENESLQVRYDDSAPGYFAVDENVTCPFSLFRFLSAKLLSNTYKVPATRTTTGLPSLMCKSDAFSSTARSSSVSIAEPMLHPQHTNQFLYRCESLFHFLHAVLFQRMKTGIF